MRPAETPKYEVYGGIKSDLEDVRKEFDSCTNVIDFPFVYLGIWAVEFPLTFVLDTLTLPITIEKTLEKRGKPTTAETTISP
jgi:uncharacterized protein YceK